MASFSFIFSLFKQTIQFLQQINVKKCPSSIWRQDSNPRPSKRESPLITTRPGLPPWTLLFWHFINTTVYNLGWYEHSSPRISYTWIIDSLTMGAQMKSSLRFQTPELQERSWCALKTSSVVTYASFCNDVLTFPFSDDVLPAETSALTSAPASFVFLSLASSNSPFSRKFLNTK